jgi:hypothetical protein
VAFNGQDAAIVVGVFDLLAVIVELEDKGEVSRNRR